MRHSIRFDSRNKIEFEHILRKHTFGTLLHTRNGGQSSTNERSDETGECYHLLSFDRKQMSDSKFTSKNEHSTAMAKTIGFQYFRQSFSFVFSVSKIAILKILVSHLLIRKIVGDQLRSKQQQKNQKKNDNQKKNASKSNISRMVQLLPVCIERASKEYH